MSRPPIPISSNLKFGARIALGGGLDKNDKSRYSSRFKMQSLNTLFRARLDLDGAGRILDKVDLGLAGQDAGTSMARRHRPFAFQGEVVQAFDRRPQVLAVEVEYERLSDRHNETLVCAAEHLLQLIGGVGVRLSILFEPVRDLERLGSS